MKKARPTNPPAVSRERTLYLRRKRRRTHPVSYTHLTLPTIA